MLQLVVIVAGALVPLFTSVWDADAVYSKWVVGSLGILITGITATISLYKLQENWIQYRVTAEALRSEKFLFLTKAQPYDGSDPFKVLVLRVEEILADQQKKWQTMIGPADKNKASDES